MFNEIIFLNEINFNPTIVDSLFVYDYSNVANYIVIQEEFLALDAVVDNFEYQKAIEDALNFVQILQVGLACNIIDSIDINELIGFELALKTITDSFNSSDSVVINALYQKIIEQTVMVWDTPQVGWGKTIADSLTTSESVTAITGLLIADWLRLSESLPVQWTTTKTIQETVLFHELVQVAKIFLDSLAETLTLTDSNLKYLGLFISEYMAGEDITLTNLSGTKTASDSMILSDLAEKGFGGDVVETLAMSDSLAGLWFLACVAQDIVSMTDTSVPQHDVNAVVFSGITLAETISLTAKYNKSVEDSLNFDIRVILDGEVYQCWVLNTDELYPSVYSGYDYNSYSELQGKVYGAKSDGIYLLEGTKDIDTDINTGVRMNLYNMGIHLEKRVYAAYFGLSGTKPVLKVINENGEVVYYLINGKVHDISKGHEGKDWIFDLAKVDSLEFAEITPVILSR